jgi:ribosomal protein S21
MEIRVFNDDIEAGIRGLKKMVSIDGVHRQIKIRLSNPKPSLRRRAKEKLALERRMVREKKKEAKEGTYERYIRRQDREIKIFERSHRIERTDVAGMLSS